MLKNYDLLRKFKDIPAFMDRYDLLKKNIFLRYPLSRKRNRNKFKKP